MKVFLDDKRNTPEGWVRVWTPEEAIQLLVEGKVTVISLDHDLGFPEPRNGYAVVKWIEEQVYTKGFKPPTILIHSANAVGVQNMIRGIESIHYCIGLPIPEGTVWNPDCPSPMAADWWILGELE